MEWGWGRERSGDDDRGAGLRMRKLVQKTLLLDSGLLQPFISFVVERNVRLRTVPVKAFLKAIRVPAFAIYVRVSPDTALRRFVTREATAGREFNEKNLEKRFENGFRLCEWFHNIYVSVQLPLVVVNAESEVSYNNIKKVAAAIVKVN